MSWGWRWEEARAVRHRKSGWTLSRPTDQRLALYSNLVKELLDHERIVTTEAKARAVKPIVEKVITLGKGATLHARRQALALLADEEVVEKVFTQLAKRYAERPGGYTRLVKLGPRLGDGAPRALLELV
jgi:large subunit ribosomal protein L17